MTSTINGKLDQALGTQAAALTLRVQRQQLIAANIANADTPGYKAVDFDFTAAMRNALDPAPRASAGTADAAARQPSAALPARTAAGHLAGTRSAYAGVSTDTRTLYRMPAQPSADGNSVDMDLERARFAQNSVRYEAALRFLNGQIKTLMSAITG